MVDIGKRYCAAELVESVFKPSAKIVQGFETYRFEMADGKVYSGFVVSTGARREEHDDVQTLYDRARAGERLEGN